MSDDPRLAGYERDEPIAVQLRESYQFYEALAHAYPPAEYPAVTNLAELVRRASEAGVRAQTQRETVVTISDASIQQLVDELAKRCDE